MFDKLDAQAVKVILAAEEESRRQGHRFVDAEQLLLGLMLDAESLPARVLETFGLKHQAVRKRINEKLGRGNEFVGVETPFTPRLSKLLETVVDDAKLSGKSGVGTTELLLGFSKVSDGIAGDILAEAGVTRDKLSAEIARVPKAKQSEELF